MTICRAGEGPEVLLLHGGAPPEATWPALRTLADRWTLLTAYRRGYEPGVCPAAGISDFAVDANDLGAALDGRIHVVAHSYGGLGALIAAARRPAAVASLTLIEPPIYFLTPEDVHVRRLRECGAAVLEDGLGADPVMLREFLRIAGASSVNDGPLSESTKRAVRRAQGNRLPEEARPDLGALRDSGVASMLVSGGHAEACERICDALAQRLGGERLTMPGAGHFVGRADGFADHLERFLLSADR
jgi:pimeloyl-ACP methyl ester carboxylesterase